MVDFAPHKICLHPPGLVLRTGAERTALLSFRYALAAIKEEELVSTFLLTPVLNSLADPAWSLSWSSGPCKIIAASADDARRLAAGQFTVAVISDPNLLHQRSPWFESRLVTAEPVMSEAPFDCLLAA